MAESERAEAAKQKERLAEQTNQKLQLEEKLAEATAQAATLQMERAGVEVG